MCCLFVARARSSDEWVIAADANAGLAVPLPMVYGVVDSGLRVFGTVDDCLVE